MKTVTPSKAACDKCLDFKCEHGWCQIYVARPNACHAFASTPNQTKAVRLHGKPQTEGVAL
jgi:Fe-S-cluster containining protein